MVRLAAIALAVACGLAIAGCDDLFSLSHVDQPDARVTGGPIRFVQSQSALTQTGSATTVSATFVKPVADGDLLIAAVATYNSEIMSVGDASGDFELIVPTHDNGGTTTDLAVFWAIADAGSPTITATAMANSPSVADMLEVSIAIHDYAGGNGTLDRSHAASGIGALANSGSVTTTIDGELYFGVTTHGDNVMTAAGSGYTLHEDPSDDPTDDTPIVTEDMIGPAQDVAATFMFKGAEANVNVWLAAIATFD